MKLDITKIDFKGRAIRLALLSSHYKKPLDWNDKLLKDAQKTLFKFYSVLMYADLEPEEDKEFLDALYNDLNTPKAIARLHALAKKKELNKLFFCLNLIGLGND